MNATFKPTSIVKSILQIDALIVRLLFMHLRSRHNELSSVSKLNALILIVNGCQNNCLKKFILNN